MPQTRNVGVGRARLAITPLPTGSANSRTQSGCAARFPLPRGSALIVCATRRPLVPHASLFRCSRLDSLWLRCRASGIRIGTLLAPPSIRAVVRPSCSRQREPARFRDRSARRSAARRSDAPARAAAPAPRAATPRRAAEQRDELAPGAHSMTSSARPSNVGGRSRPSLRAVLTLMANSNLFGACTGRSPGLAPFRIRST